MDKLNRNARRRKIMGKENSAGSGPTGARPGSNKPDIHQLLQGDFEDENINHLESLPGWLWHLGNGGAQ